MSPDFHSTSFVHVSPPVHIQTIAPVFPLAVARVTQRAGGAAIGVACLPLAAPGRARARA
ncbi:MAG TPA: hypothetical protein DDZ42_01240 [Candidatus Rokubacteria bacterium]|nr:MAG: hypothetical protein A2050_16315 [Candidatus Rokubacteria bacterium GWA2_73_35]HBH00534.1 hypothetical protein [Candidatus Rokubacteria bacterium]